MIDLKQVWVYTAATDWRHSVEDILHLSMKHLNSIDPKVDFYLQLHKHIIISALNMPDNLKSGFMNYPLTNIMKMLLW